MSLRHNAIVAYAETNVMKKSDRDAWVVFGSKHGNFAPALCLANHFAPITLSTYGQGRSGLVANRCDARYRSTNKVVLCKPAREGFPCLTKVCVFARRWLRLWAASPARRRRARKGRPRHALRGAIPPRLAAHRRGQQGNDTAAEHTHS